MLSQTKPDPRCVWVCSRVSIFMINWEQFTNAGIHLMYKRLVLFQELMKNQEWKYKIQQNALVRNSILVILLICGRIIVAALMHHDVGFLLICGRACISSQSTTLESKSACILHSLTLYILWYGVYYNPFLKKMVRVLCLWLEEWDGACHGTIQVDV